MFYHMGLLQINLLKFSCATPQIRFGS